MNEAQLLEQGFGMAKTLAPTLGIVCGVFGLLTVGWEYGKRLAYSSRPDWGVAMKIGALVLLLATYRPIVNGFVWTGQLIGLSLRTEALAEQVIKYNTGLMNQMQTHLEAMETSVGTVEETEVHSQLTNAHILIGSVMLWLFHVTTDGLFTLRDVLLAILIGLGPVAIALTVLRLFDRSFSHWLQSLMALLIWKAVVYAGFRIIVLMHVAPNADWITVSIAMMVVVVFMVVSFRVAGLLVRQAATGLFHSQYFTLNKI